MELLQLYILVSAIISAFAVYDYGSEIGSKNIVLLLAIWVVFLILWPFVLLKSVHTVFMNLKREKKRKA